MSFIRCTNSNEATSNGFTYCRCTCWFAFRSWDRNYWHNCSYLFALRSKRKTPWSALMAPLFPSDPFGFCSSFRIEISALLEAQATKWFDSFCAWSICANHSVLDQFQPHDPHLSVCVCVQQVSYFSFSSQICYCCSAACIFSLENGWNAVSMLCFCVFLECIKWDSEFRRWTCLYLLL